MMREIYHFKPQFNLKEKNEVKELTEQIWDKVKDLELGDYIILNSIKIEKTENEIIVLDTSTEPFHPIYNRFLLRLIRDNILDGIEDDDMEEE